MTDEVVGIDLGGTNVTAARVTPDGTKHATHTCPTGEGHDILTHIRDSINAVTNTHDPKIGIGTPGFVHNNKIGSNPNVNGLSKAIQQLKHDYTTVKVENDANCFALAEHTWGAGQDTDDMIGLIWGTGIGAGIIANGQLIKGTIGGAGEAGHIAAGFDRKEFCPGCPGTWEHLCSGPNIIRRYHDAGGDDNIQRPDELLQHDDLADDIITETIHYMGVGIGSLVNVLNPELVILGGGVSNMPVYDELNQALTENAVRESADACTIVENECGDDAGILGAAKLVF